MASANIEKLEVEIEVECSGDMLYHTYKNGVSKLVDHLPHIFEGVQVVEAVDDEIRVGSVKIWNYKLEGKSLCLKERVTVLDDEKRMITFNIFEGEVMNDYKCLDITLIITPREVGNGSVVKWILEYEKANEDSPIPTAYMDLIGNGIKEISSILHNSCA